MTTETIEDILKTRIAVYKAGVMAGFWQDINESGAKVLTAYLFPKSGTIAHYNIIMEYMHKEHRDFTGGVYYLFKMPVQVEKEVMDYLKKNLTDVESLVPDADVYLASRDTIVTDKSISYVKIGSFRDSSIDDLLRLCATHYRYSFSSGVKAIPYFE